MEAVGETHIKVFGVMRAVGHIIHSLRTEPFGKVLVRLLFAALEPACTSRIYLAELNEYPHNCWAGSDIWLTGSV